MAATARTITVVVDADSAPFQGGMDEAAAALENFGRKLAGLSVETNGSAADVVAANGRIAESYVATNGKVNGSVTAQAEVVAKAASAANGYAADTGEALGKVGEAWKASTAEILDEYGFFQGRMLAAQADAADRLLAGQEALSERTVAVQREQYDAMLEDQAAYLDRAVAEQALAQERMVATIGETDAKLVAAQDAMFAGEGEVAAASTRSTGMVVANNEKAAKSFGDSGTALVNWGKKAALGVLGIGAASIYMSSEFEKATLRLHTQAGASVSELHALEKGVLSLGLKGGAGQTPKALEEGLYHVVSSMDKVLPAGTRVNEMLHIMQIAAEGAAVGGTSMEETSYALASAMNALHERGGDASKTMAEMNAIVGSGDMTMQDLLASMKSGLIPTAETFGVSFQSVGAALAVMGDMGMRGAQAGTRLRMSLALLGGPSKQAAEILKTLGMNSTEASHATEGMREALEKAGLTTTSVAADLKHPDGIVYALQDLKDHLEKAGLNATETGSVLVRAFGGGRMASTIDLLVGNLDRVRIKYDQIGTESGKFAGDYQKTTETLSFKLKELGSVAETVGIDIGKFLTPAAKDVVGGLIEMGTWLEKKRTRVGRARDRDPGRARHGDHRLRCQQVQSPHGEHRGGRQAH